MRVRESFTSRTYWLAYSAWQMFKIARVVAAISG
jgi:hypothetical protein